MRTHMNKLLSDVILDDKALIFPDAHETDQGDFEPTFNRVGMYELPWSESVNFIPEPIQMRGRHCN